MLHTFIFLIYSIGIRPGRSELQAYGQDPCGLEWAEWCSEAPADPDNNPKKIGIWGGCGGWPDCRRSPAGRLRLPRLGRCIPGRAFRLIPPGIAPPLSAMPHSLSQRPLRGPFLSSMNMQPPSKRGAPSSLLRNTGKKPERGPHCGKLHYAFEISSSDEYFQDIRMVPLKPTTLQFLRVTNISQGGSQGRYYMLYYYC